MSTENMDLRSEALRLVSSLVAGEEPAGVIERFARRFPGHESPARLVSSIIFSKNNMKQLRQCQRLLRVAREPVFRYIGHYYTALVYLRLGNHRAAESHARLCLESGVEPVGARRLLAELAMFSGRVDVAEEILPESHDPATNYLRGILRFIDGDFAEAESILRKTLAEWDTERAVREALGFLYLCSGRYPEARKNLEASLEDEVRRDRAYALYPALKLCFLNYLEGKPITVPGTVMRLVNRSDPELRPCLAEKQALTLAAKQRFYPAAQKEFEAAHAYFHSAQSLEAVHALAWATYWAWNAGRELFFVAARELSDRMDRFRFIGKHSFMGEFLERTVASLPGAPSRSPVLRINMFGGFEVKGAPAGSSWRSKKSLQAFKYLLLNEGKAMEMEYLSYLLWPDSPFDAKTRSRLYSCVYTIRKNLGSLRGALARVGNAYRLSPDPGMRVDVWEFLRRARYPRGAEDLVEAVMLYRGKLLPEDRYDPYIEEHRDYLHKRFGEILERAVRSLVKAHREHKALELAEMTYRRFPVDDPAARVYIDLLRNMGRSHEARRVYEEFKTRLWRKHRFKPSFKI